MLNSRWYALRIFYNRIEPLRQTLDGTRSLFRMA